MDCSPPDSSVHGIFPGQNTGVGCYFLLQWIFPTQGLKPTSPSALAFTTKSLGKLEMEGCTLNEVLLTVHATTAMCNESSWPLTGLRRRLSPKEVWLMQMYSTY